MVAQPEIFGVDVKRIQPIAAESSPIFKPLQIRAGLAEEFKLHLLKFTHAEDELAGVISFLKDLPICATPKGTFFLVVL
jgi:hypothetical protein